MPRPAPDQRKVDLAWELVTIQGKTLHEAGRIIGEKFDCSPPCTATVRLWAKQNRKLRECYLHLMDLDRNRELAAFRHRQLWAMTYHAIADGEIPYKDGVQILLKVVESDRKLFGMDAATKIIMQNTPPGVDEKILAAVKTFHAEDKGAY